MAALALATVLALCGGALAVGPGDGGAHFGGGGGHAPMMSQGGRHFGGHPPHHFHARNNFVFVYPYYPYGYPYYPGYAYNPTCDPYSPYYDPEYCDWDEGP